MAFRMVRLAVLPAVVLLASIAIGQVRPKSTKLPTPPHRVTEHDGKVASAEEVDFTRFRIVTEQGILAVFDADEDWDGRDEPLSQLAYWHDLASEQLFFFDQRLFTLDDVLQSVATMPRDLNIEITDVLSERPDFDPLPEITSPGQWIPATELDVVSVMSGGTSGANGEGEVSGLAMPCVPGNCGPAMATTGPLVAPNRGTSQQQLFAMAQSGSQCNCTGPGGGCIPGLCSDGNPCTGPDQEPCGQNPGCQPGPPKTGNACASDGISCTWDKCNNGVCTHPVKPPGSSCVPETPANPCKIYTCSGYECVPSSNQPNGTACPDESPSNVCTQDVCEGGNCQHKNEPMEGAACASDDVNCTNDVCRAGQCMNEEEGCPGNSCDSASDCRADNDPCTLLPQCNNGYCAEPPKNCDDGNLCSTDRCNPESGLCEHTNFSTPIPEADRCETYGCDITLAGLPSVLPVNDDDDNGNGIADFEEEGEVANENDVLCTTFTSTGCPLSGGPACYEHCQYDHWHALASSSAVGLFSNADREPLTLELGCPEWPPPSQWCIEGRPSAMGACAQGWDIQVVGWDSEPGHCCNWRSEPFSVVKIASLMWEKAHPSNEDLSQCPNNGGVGIVPVQGSGQQVKLVATVTPTPPAPLRVYFTVFDVAGNGNEPLGLPWTTSAETGTNGRPLNEAEVTFTVSLAPGNNYRAAASQLQEALTQDTIQNDQQVTPQQHAVALNTEDGCWSGYSTPLTWSAKLEVQPQVDLNVDSNNDGIVDAADDLIEENAPGKVILVNDDDENTNGVPDLSDLGGFPDDELIALQIVIQSLPAVIPPDSYWQMDFPSSVKLYRHPNRTDLIQSGTTNPFPVPSQAYVEGVTASAAPGDVPIGLTVAVVDAPISTDSVTLTVLELAVDVSGDIDADTHSSAVAAVFSPFFEPDLSSAVEALPLSFSVRRNGVGQADQTFSISEGTATLGFTTSTTPGDQYSVETFFFDAKRISDVFAIVPGQPANVTQQSTGSLVADGTGTVTVVAEIRDQYGNRVEDGTSLEWMLKDTTGLLQNGSVETITNSGIARAVVVASSVPTTQVLSILSAPTVRDVTMPVLPVSGSLNGPASLDIAQNATGTVSLSTNASDGTPVYWTLSNGNTPFAETVVSQGTSALPVSAAKAPFNFSRVGPCYITAAVGDRFLGHQIDFVSSASFHTKINRFVLSGDVISDGFTTIELPNVQEIPGFPSLVPTTYTSVPHFARTNVNVYGVPGGAYIVSLVNKPDTPYVAFSGLDPGNRLILDLNGVGTFELQSQGNFDGLIPTSNFLHVSVRVNKEDAPAQAQVDVVTLVERSWWAQLSDGVGAFVGLDPPKTGFGIAANVAGGMLVIGDVGSLVRNAWLALPFTDGDPNVVEASLSALGLLTELAIGIGEVADIPITNARAIVAAIGKTPFADALHILLKRAIANAQELPKLASFLARIIADPANNIPFARAVFTSVGLLESGTRAADEIGDAFFSAVRPIAQDAALNGVQTAQKIVKTLDNLPSAVLAALKNSGKFDEAMQGLAKAIHHGGLDPDTARKILSNNFFGPAYSQAEICIDLGKIGRAPGFPTLAKKLRSVAPQNYGTLYELQVAAHFAVDGGANLTHISKFVRADPTHIPPVTQTDIDLVIGDVYYQVKRNVGAFLGGVSQDDAVEKTWIWILKARNDGASSIKYVTQPGIQIPAKIEALLAREQIEVIRVLGS